jgi:uncharacterized C2H2 Zn-finger protein
MQTQMKECATGFICMICGKNIKKRNVLKVHMRDIHGTTQYYCPPCDKMFKNKACIYVHIKRAHPDWQVVDYGSFRVF